jgi:hypothetical protein
MQVKNLEDEVRCPIDGCDSTAVARGLHIHVYQTDDPEGSGHYPRGEVPPDFDPKAVEVEGQKEVEMDFPQRLNMQETEYLCTFCGSSFQGRRGLFIHLGQSAGKNNIPENVTDRFEPDDFPIVETDDDGNIEEVVKWGDSAVPPLEPYLPWVMDYERGYVDRERVVDFVDKIKNSPTGAASAEAIEDALLK